MDCPSCKSSQTQKFSVVYQSGSSSGSFTGLGAGVSRAGLSGSVFGGTTQSQTMLAKRVAPPTMLSRVAVFLLAVFSVGTLFAAVIKLTDSSLGFGFGALTVIVILFAIVAVANYFAQKRIFPVRMSRWENSWLCMQCGHEWVEE